MQFGEFLQNLREKRGLSQTDYGRLAGMSRPMVDKIERGNRRPNLDKLAAMMKPLGLNLQDEMQFQLLAAAAHVSHPTVRALLIAQITRGMLQDARLDRLDALLNQIPMPPQKSGK